MISTDKTVNPTNVKRRSFDTYAQTIGALSGASLMPEAPRGRATREDIRLALERQDIESRPLWKPMHLQPVFAGYEAILPRSLPAREGLGEDRCSGMGCVCRRGRP